MIVLVDSMMMHDDGIDEIVCVCVWCGCCQNLLSFLLLLAQHTHTHTHSHNTPHHHKQHITITRGKSLAMDTSQCDGIKFQYDRCINDKLSAMKSQKPDVDCEEMFEQWRDCYSAAVKTFIAKSKEKSGK